MHISGHRLSLIITTLLLCLWIFAGCASGTTDSALTDSRASAPGEEAPASTALFASSGLMTVPAPTVICGHAFTILAIEAWAADVL